MNTLSTSVDAPLSCSSILFLRELLKFPGGGNSYHGTMVIMVPYDFKSRACAAARSASCYGAEVHVVHLEGGGVVSAVPWDSL